MDIRRPEIADISNRCAVSIEGVGHDRPIAAEFEQLRDHLEVRAQPGRRGDFKAEFGHGLHPRVLLRALPGGHHMEDAIHKTVEADQTARLRQDIRAGGQKIGRRGGQ